MAESPPPTTATFLALKKGASHGAQEETPLPMKLLSPGTSSQTVSAPAAIMTAFAKYHLFPDLNRKGVLLKSTSTTFSLRTLVPNFSAWLRMASMRSGP